MASPLYAPSPLRQNSVRFSDTNTVSVSSSNTWPTVHLWTLSLLDFSFWSKASAAHAHSQSQPLQQSNLFKNTLSNQQIKHRDYSSKIYKFCPASTPSMDCPTPLTPNTVQQDQPPPPPHQFTNSVNQPPPQLHPKILLIV